MPVIWIIYRLKCIFIGFFRQLIKSSILNYLKYPTWSTFEYSASKYKIYLNKHLFPSVPWHKKYTRNSKIIRCLKQIDGFIKLFFPCFYSIRIYFMLYLFSFKKFLFSFFWDNVLFCATSVSGLGTICSLSVMTILTWLVELIRELIQPWVLRPMAYLGVVVLLDVLNA